MKIVVFDDSWCVVFSNVSVLCVLLVDGVIVSVVLFCVVKCLLGGMGGGLFMIDWLSRFMK